MGRDRQYDNNAERQRAYRERKAQEQARLREELRRARSGPPTKAEKRDKLSKRLVKVLGMLGSDYANERDNAARMAAQMLKDAGFTWYDVLNVTEDK